MTACERDNCGHQVNQHEASGPCLVDGCRCPGFALFTRAQRKAREITRCSGCGRRVRRFGPHGRVETKGTWHDCPRKGLEPDRREDWKQ